MIISKKDAAIKRALNYYEAIVYPANQKDFDQRNPLPRLALLKELKLINERYKNNG